MTETIQVIVGVFVIAAFFFCLWVAIREIRGIYRDMKDGGWL